MIDSDDDIVDFLERLEARKQYVREWKYCWDEREKARTEAMEKRMAEIREHISQQERHKRAVCKRKGQEGGELAAKKAQEAWQGEAEQQREKLPKSRGKISFVKKSRWERSEPRLKCLGA